MIIIHKNSFFEWNSFLFTFLPAGIYGEIEYPLISIKTAPITTIPIFSYSLSFPYSKILCIHQDERQPADRSGFHPQGNGRAGCCSYDLSSGDCQERSVPFPHELHIVLRKLSEPHVKKTIETIFYNVFRNLIFHYSSRCSGTF